MSGACQTISTPTLRIALFFIEKPRKVGHSQDDRQDNKAAFAFVLDGRITITIPAGKIRSRL
jgi:hypothetical protein